jgi:hypothetical protein
VVFRNIVNADQLQVFSFRYANFDKSFALSSQKPFACPIDMTGIKTDRKISSEGLDCNFRRRFFNKATDKNDIERL